MKLVYGIAFAAALTASQAGAATLTFFDDVNDPLSAQFTLEFDSCEALLTQPGNYSPTTGQMFTVHPPSDENEEAFVSANTNPAEVFDVSNKSEEDDFIAPRFTGDPDDVLSFSTTAAYILFKIGGGQDLSVALLRNISGGSIYITYTKLSGSNGLSHINEFGTSTSTIPLPAAGWLLLTGLGALGFASRKRRRAVA